MFAARAEDPDDACVWAVTCFVTRAGYRRRGVSRALARATVAFARERGARALEGYPMITHPGRGDHVGRDSTSAAAASSLTPGFTEVGHPTLRRVSCASTSSSPGRLRRPRCGRDQSGGLHSLRTIRILLRMAESSSREIRCTRAEQDDLRLAGRPPPLPASAGARRRQPVGRHLRCSQSLRRHRGGQARGLRRGHRSGRDRQGPQGPLHRRPPRRVDQHEQQRRRAVPGLARPDRQVRRSTSSGAPTSRWSTRTASRPAGAAISASGTSATAPAPPSRPSTSSTTLDELRPRIPPQLYDMVARAPGEPEVEDLDV